MTRLGPTFIIGGAPRSGTTWLYHLLDRHPDVYMARPIRPEPKFFLIDELYARGIGHYFDTWFSERTDQRAAGEKTTNYLESALAAERIQRHLPSVQLVFILREPAQRAYSNWAWSRMNGLETEEFSIALGLEEQRERTPPPHLRYARPHAYFSRGLYAAMLKPYLALFGRDQVLCLKFEDIIETPAALASRVHQFIGVAPRPDDAEDLGAINPSDTPGEVMQETVRMRLRERYAGPNEELAHLLGPSFTAWGAP